MVAVRVEKWLVHQISDSLFPQHYFPAILSCESRKSQLQNILHLHVVPRKIIGYFSLKLY